MISPAVKRPVWQERKPAIVSQRIPRTRARPRASVEPTPTPRRVRSPRPVVDTVLTSRRPWKITVIPPRKRHCRKRPEVVRARARGRRRAERRPHLGARVAQARPGDAAVDLDQRLRGRRRPEGRHQRGGDGQRHGARSAGMPLHRVACATHPCSCGLGVGPCSGGSGRARSRVVSWLRRSPRRDRLRGVSSTGRRRRRGAFSGTCGRSPSVPRPRGSPPSPRLSSRCSTARQRAARASRGRRCRPATSCGRRPSRNGPAQAAADRLI